MGCSWLALFEGRGCVAIFLSVALRSCSQERKEVAAAAEARPVRVCVCVRIICIRCLFVRVYDLVFEFGESPGVDQVGRICDLVGLDVRGLS